MTDQPDNLPMASKEMEEHVRKIFPLDVDPEEFAAKDGDGWLDFVFSNYRFTDETLDQWIQTVGKIIRDPKKLDEVQHKYLSEEDLTRMKKYTGVDLDDDDDF